MTRSLLAFAALALPLAACGGGSEPAAPAPDAEVAVPVAGATAAPAGAYEAQLRNMPEESRNATFIRAIRDAGQDCQGVTNSAAREPIRGAPTWTATCSDGRTWYLLLGSDGVVQVTHEEELRAGGVQP